MSSIKIVSISALVALVFAAAGYAGGRYMTPARVVVTEKVKIEFVEKQVVVEKVVTEIKLVKVTDTIKNVVTERVVEKKPDGTVTVHETTKDQSVEKTKTDTEIDKTKNTTSTKDTKQTLDQSKVTVTEKQRLGWSFTLQPGFDFAGMLGKGNAYSLLPTSFPIKRFVVGASIERRLIGPISTGIWANSAGAGGLSIRVDF